MICRAPPVCRNACLAEASTTDGRKPEEDELLTDGEDTSLVIGLGSVLG